MNYDIGDSVRLSTVFTDSSGAAVDPASVVLRIRRGSSKVLDVYSWPSGSGIVHSSTGNFHIDIVPTCEGLHAYRWESNSPGQTAADEENFYVRPSRVFNDQPTA